MKKKSYIIPALSAVCVLAVILMILSLTFGGKTRFTPPEFDSAAISGTPEVEDKSWSKIYKDGMSFAAYVCGKVTVKGDSADVYFTSVAENTVWLKLRITDEAGNILGETGVIKPNQYVKSVRFDTVPAVGTKIKLKILGYEPETYYSAGAVSLNTEIGG